MATSAANTDYLNARPVLRTRTTGGNPSATATSPRSPRTPQLGRSISSQFGSPGAFRTEPEEYIIYELGSRHLSVGFSGEARPRCVLFFDPDSGRRAGDYRAFEPDHTRHAIGWSDQYELYQNDVRGLDLGLMGDKFERAIRQAHTDYLQLDQKSRKAILAVPSLFPTPLLQVVLKSLFNHSSQPSSITILSVPLLACVGAGLRNALVIDVGWQETTVTAVGEYKEVAQKRSVRAGKALTKAMAEILQSEVERHDLAGHAPIDFHIAERVTQRMAWCQARTSNTQRTKEISIPMDSGVELSVPFVRLSQPVESTFFASPAKPSELDNHDLTPHVLAHRVLLSLPKDLRASCLSRIIITGGLSRLPGFKRRLLEEIEHLVEHRGWDPVHSYGKAQTKRDIALRHRSSNTTLRPNSAQTAHQTGSRPPSSKEGQESVVPASLRSHDDITDQISIKAERRSGMRRDAQDISVQGVETVGAWAGASLIANLRVKGVHEVERDEFQRHGLRDLSEVL